MVPTVVAVDHFGLTSDAHARPGRGVLPLLACCLFISVGAACGAESADSQPRTTWTIAVPTVVPRTLEEALKIIGSDPAVGPSSFFVGELSAAVFEFEDDRPNTQHPEWQTLVDDLCGPNGLLAQALAAGWDVTVTGFVDSTGPSGPGTFNAGLQIARAEAAAQLLSEACPVPANRIHAAPGGVGGDDASGRKVTVTYTRT